MTHQVCLFWLQIGVSQTTALSPCVIDCSGQTGEHLTADPVNCKNYYICFDSEDHSIYPFTCEGTMYFDINTNSCRESDFTCTPECEKCSFNCSANGTGSIASSVDCGIYYTCDTGELSQCPPERPYFDGYVCQTNKQSCCTCKSLCTQSDVDNRVMVADLRNCTNYYLCMRPGIQEEITHGHCPFGNFDSSAEVCDEAAPCIQPCAWESQTARSHRYL